MKLQLLQAKNKCIKNLHTTTGILMDYPNFGTSGNTNSGPLTEKLFSFASRSFICDLIPNSEDRENYRHFLHLTNVMIQACISVDPNKLYRDEEIKLLGTELMGASQNIFSWRKWHLLDYVDTFFPPDVCPQLGIFSYKEWCLDWKMEWNSRRKLEQTCLKLSK